MDDKKGVLSNSEIRLAIAKAKGYEIYYDSSVNHINVLYETHHPATFVAKPFSMYVPANSTAVGSTTNAIDRWICPNWPEDIGAAKGLTEEMRPHFFSIVVICWDHTDRVAVECHYRQGHDEHIPPVCSEDTTEERARSLAWLAWKEGHND